MIVLGLITCPVTSLCSGQTRWRCTSSTEMERSSRWKDRPESRCWTSSSTRTWTLTVLVCTHTHFWRFESISESVCSSSQSWGMLRCLCYCGNFLAWKVQFRLPVLDLPSHCPSVLCPLTRSVWGNAGLLHVPSDLRGRRLQEVGEDHGRGNGHAGPGLRPDGHVRNTHRLLFVSLFNSKGSCF